jgi:thymidylate synthase (FAD)
MKTITSPEIFLVGRPSVDEEQLLAFLDDNDVETWTTDAVSDGVKIPEVAGRVCYMSFGKPRPGGNQGYLSHIKEVGHGSVLEHSTWNFILQGISRSLTHELVRHRVGTAFSQLSQRYVDSSDVGFVVPPQLELEVECFRYRRLVGWEEGDDYERLSTITGIDLQDAVDALEEKASKLYPRAHAVDIEVFHTLADAGERWLKSMENAQDDYAFLTEYLAEKVARTSEGNKTEDRKKAREAARSVLPNATETKLFLSANARAMRHFFSLRCSRHADAEIRRFAIKLLRTMQVEAPALFEDFEIRTLADGSEEAITSYPKV